jgi:imidazolonepropionase-like amidohydrolase
LWMGTHSGAEALGRDRDVGSLAPGKLANLVAVPLVPDRYPAASSMLEALFERNELPSAVWIRGRRAWG